MNYQKSILLPLFLVSIYCFGSELKGIDEVKDALGVEIITDTTFHGTWTSVSYDKIQDTVRIINYLNLLLVEYGKYPKGYLHNVSVEKIILCDNLIYYGQKRAAIPDPYKKALYLEIDSNNTKNYLIHVMHHELHHCTEYSLYNDMYYKWEEWEKINISNFKYGKGGGSAYEGSNKKIDWYDMSHPVEGFVNLYSTTGEEEDRSEIVALIMNDDERYLLFKYCKDDLRLRRKVKLVLTELDKVIDAQSKYWDEKMDKIGED